MKPIKPREARSSGERARLFWQWAFEEIKKGIIAKNALNNVSMRIGKEQVIDVDHSDDSNSVSSFGTDYSFSNDPTPEFKNQKK